MKRKSAFAALPPSSASMSISEGEIVTVLGPGEGRLPRRRSAPGMKTGQRFVAVLGSLIDSDFAVPELNFTKAIEARSPATLRAMTCELESYALFASQLAGAGLPASAERLVQWIDHFEKVGRKPATIARNLATVHDLLGMPAAVSSALVRDAMKGMRRRQGKSQRQAAGLRLGEAIGVAPV